MIFSFLTKDRFLGMSLKLHFLFVCILSLILLYVGNSFTDNVWITFPQFSDLKHFAAKMELANVLFNEYGYTSLWSYFKGFFFLDMIWSFLTLSLVVRYVAYLMRDEARKQTIKRFIQVLTIIASIAYLLDVTENILYLSAAEKSSFSDSFLKNLRGVVAAKTIFFLITGILSLFVLIFQTVNSALLKSFIDFIKTSFLSLGVIGIIVLLITSIGQGTTIIVDFMEHPVDILIMLASMYYISIIIAHYPIYFGRIKQKESDWKIVGPFKKWGLGLIYFSYKKIKRGEERCPENCGKKEFLKQLKHENFEQFRYRKLYKNIRNYLGVLVHLSIIYIVFFVGAKTFDWKLSAFNLTSAVCVGLTWLYIWFDSPRWERPEKIYGDEYEEEIKGEKRFFKNKKRPYLLASKYPFALIILALLIIFTSFVSYYSGWSRLTIFFVEVTLIWSAVVYMIFKKCRTTFKYVFLSNRTLKIEKSNDEWPKENGMYEEGFPIDVLSSLLKNSKMNNLWKWMHIDRLSSNIDYLRLISVGTTLTILFIIAINVSIDFAIKVNPLNIILLYLSFFYSIIVIIIKVYLFRQEQSLTDQNQSRPVFCRIENWIAFGLLLFFGWHFVAPSFESDLHDIKMTQSNSIPMEMKAFKSNWESQTNEGQRPVVVASYGGGLKADIWNLLLFQKIQKSTRGKFVKNSICWSGVSGGTMGIANYYSLYNYNDEKSILTNEFGHLDNRIDSLGKYNFLSIDVGMLMGRDYIKELLPFFKWKGEDRSYMAMKYHAQLTGMGDEFDQHSFVDLNNELIDKYGHFPAFIVNTVSTNGHQGIACSIGLPDEMITPGAIDILSDYRKDSLINDLTFYGASSTTNRFPVLAPSARVEKKGHFLDGGYFDNSGLVSAWEFYQRWEAIESDRNDTLKVVNSPEPIFVNIINDKSSYIRYMLEEWGIKQIGDRAQGEIGSILSAVASTDKVPNYISEKLGDSLLIEIQMPMKFDMQDVINVLSGEPADINELASIIRLNNEVIDNCLIEAYENFKSVKQEDPSSFNSSYANYNLDRWGVVEPPLARLMSEPAVEYQKAMIQYHPHIIEQIKLLDFRMNEQ